MYAMRTSDFSYDLPEELIAQTPIEPRDHSRLLVYHRSDRSIEHRRFDDIVDYLHPGDALVINNTKVIPARLTGEKADSGIPVEVLLLKRLSTTDWETIVRPARRLKTGAVCIFGGNMLRCEILDNVPSTGGRIVRFHFNGVFEELLDRLGETPLPPYIHEKLADPSRYQTVYAKTSGSAAAPTAGLHFTDELLERIRSKCTEIVPILLHVGLGTFRPVQSDNIEEHVMHSEFCEVSPEAADVLNRVRAKGGRIVCVGTTSVRTLESRVNEDGTITPGRGDTNIFILPGFPVRATDALITNFHLPKSTLLMLVSAFMGREEVLRAYSEAVRLRYRFFSFGDAMFID